MKTTMTADELRDRMIASHDEGQKRLLELEALSPEMAKQFEATFSPDYLRMIGGLRDGSITISEA